MVVRGVRKNRPPNARVTLLEVGDVLERLMGGAYRSQYCRRGFKARYYQATQDKYSVSTEIEYGFRAFICIFD